MSVLLTLEELEALGKRPMNTLATAEIMALIAAAKDRERAQDAWSKVFRLIQPYLVDDEDAIDRLEQLLADRERLEEAARDAIKGLTEQYQGRDMCRVCGCFAPERREQHSESCGYVALLEAFSLQPAEEAKDV